MFLASYILEVGVGNWAPFQAILASSSTVANTGHLHWKAEGSIHVPSNCSVKVWELSCSRKRALKGGKAFKDQVLCLMNSRLWCPWWKHSLPSILILKKERVEKNPNCLEVLYYLSCWFVNIENLNCWHCKGQKQRQKFLLFTDHWKFSLNRPPGFDFVPGNTTILNCSKHFGKCLCLLKFNWKSG